MIEMGARPEAVSAKGAGEKDLAVPTQDGVREQNNRRSVIGLASPETRVSAR
jgi:outer membrane protein OmpA-like peptidoglycan-associated protein